MNNERYNQIIHEAYENYREKNHILFKDTAWTQQEFINKIKTNLEFSERWGLKIEERELSEDERYDLCAARKSKMTAISEEDYIKYNIPTKLITITYKDEKIEVYE